MGDREPWLVASRLRDHILTPKERRDPLLWKMVVLSSYLYPLLPLEFLIHFSVSEHMFLIFLYCTLLLFYPCVFLLLSFSFWFILFILNMKHVQFTVFRPCHLIHFPIIYWCSFDFLLLNRLKIWWNQTLVWTAIQSLWRVNQRWCGNGKVVNLSLGISFRYLKASFATQV